MIRVSKRDFLLKPNEYIKEGTFILTLRGKDYIQVTFSGLLQQDVTTSSNVTTLQQGNNVTTSDVTTSNVTTLKKDVTTKETLLRNSKEPLPPVERVKAPEGSGTAKILKTSKEVQDEINKLKEYKMYHHTCGCKKKESILCSTHNRA